MSDMKVGAEMFVEKGGRGWRKIEGYEVVVLSREEAVQFESEGGFIEGLGLEADMFVEVPGEIYADDEGEASDLDNEDREVEYDGYSVWGIDGSGKLIELN
jgi:hypothetical protein